MLDGLISMNRKRIVFLTGTRADFGKLKSLISITQQSKEYEVHLFVTGMHMNSLYGLTIDEIRKSGFDNIYPYINHDSIDNMDRTLSKTIDGFSHFISEIKPDLIIVHGDRVEALAGAITGSLNNILVAHIEGGEVSGTIDELIRHAVSKMSHIHLVANVKAKIRLVQLGELPNSIFILGSPDLDLMNPEKLPKLSDVKKYYNIEFDNFAIAMFHPVTTEFKSIKKVVKEFVNSLIESDENYIVIYPNNDLGSHEILNEYKRLEDNRKIRLFPSLRFEYFLVFLKNSNYIVGNSSAGIREASYYGTPTVDIGSRQNNRSQGESIFHANNESESILRSIDLAKNFKNNDANKDSNFGQGVSNKIFLKLLDEGQIWSIDCQKQFQDLEYE
jgi:UDP-N-acetylglucosamine 2-epimerase (hydrolysing)